jgi:hypothetical protein
MNVVVTAPMPGISTPSFPSAGAIWTLSLFGNMVLLNDASLKMLQMLEKLEML